MGIKSTQKRIHEARHAAGLYAYHQCEAKEGVPRLASPCEMPKGVYLVDIAAELQDAGVRILNESRFHNRQNNFAQELAYAFVLLADMAGATGVSLETEIEKLLSSHGGILGNFDSDTKVKTQRGWKK